jgi:hypothetical protein
MVLSLLVSVQFHTISESKGYKLVHLSVHDGTVLATSYLNETYSDVLAGEKRFDLYWASNSSPYEARPVRFSGSVLWRLLTVIILAGTRQL